jgi:GNAT superfamily N-acetyltransferase
MKGCIIFLYYLQYTIKTGTGMLIRNLSRNELGQIWQIDRREVIEAVYYWVGGQLVLQPEHYDMQGWPPGEAEKYTPILLESFDRGGVFFGAFEDGDLVGVAVLESQFIGQPRDQLQLSFLHVSRDYRGRGLGKRLFELVKARAREMGARRLYISATPSEHTVNFYQSLGCTLAPIPDPVLFAREPEDIHLECHLVSIRAAEASDTEAIGDVYLASRKAFLPYAPLAHTDEEVRRWIGQVLIPRGGVFVAVSGDEIVGMMALSKDEHTGWIDQIYLRPEAVGLGIGTRLVGRAKAELGLPIRLYTFQQNQAARRFYERHGFGAIAFTEGRGNEEQCPDMLYELARSG